MSNSPGAFRRLFVKDDGAVTVEVVLWLGPLILLFVMVCDMTFLFYGRNQLLQTVEEANRSYSVGEFTTDAEAETYIKDAFAPISTNLIVDTQLVDGVVQTTATVPADDLTAVGLHQVLGNFDITVLSRQVFERRSS